MNTLNIEHLNSEKITILAQHIEAIYESREAIITLWLDDGDVRDILVAHNIEVAAFAHDYAYAILFYYVEVVRGDKMIGDCPVVAKLLEFLKSHEITSGELFTICTHFRKAMVSEMFLQERMSLELYDALSYVFDANFRGVLDAYNTSIFKAQRRETEQILLFEQFNSAIDESALVSKTDANGRITYVNEKFVEASGYSAEELIGKNHNIIRHPDMEDNIFHEMWHTIQSGEIYHGILKNRRKNGTSYYVEATILPLLNIEGKIKEYLAIRYEVSELIQARDVAIEAEKSKDMFLANMSHEIRTPLNAILGFVEVLRERVKDDKNRHYLEIIHNSGKTLLTIIGDILDFAKIKSGKLDIEKHPFDLASEFETVIELFAATAYEKKISFLTYIDPHLPREIVADSVRIKQVLGNFLSNAFKFTQNEGTVRVDIKMRGNNLIIAVKDSGIGISTEQKARIFKAFEQAEGSTTRKFGGTGLGLSICGKLAELMGGDIELESVEHEGSTFKLIVPVEIRSASHFERPQQSVSIAQETLQTQEGTLFKNYTEGMYAGFLQTVRILSNATSEIVIVDESSFELHEITTLSIKSSVIVLCKTHSGEKYADLQNVWSLALPLNAHKIDKLLGEAEDSISLQAKETLLVGKVLVAEDNRANQQLISILLDDLGLEFVIANNGQEAVDAFKKDSFDLVLMDQQMPILSGIESAKAILAYEAEHELVHTPIVALTANALKGDKEYYLANGMDEYLQKPIDVSKFEALMRKIIVTNKGKHMDVPNYSNLNAVEMAANIGLKEKHIPILVMSFTEESTQIVADLKTAISTMNFSEIQHHAHSIKGSAGNLKFDALYEMAKEMEFAARDEDSNYNYAEVCDVIGQGISSISLA